MQAAIDIGHSGIKAGIFSGSRLLEVLHPAPGDLTATLQQRAVKKLILAPVNKELEKAVLPGLQKFFPGMLVLTSATRLPFALDYLTPGTLGVDRLAAVAGALAHSRPPLAVIDAGTCITCDLVDSRAVFRGGTISPGLRMRLQAMHRFTTSLPEVALRQPGKPPGRTTEEAMLHGAVTAARHELAGMLSDYAREAPGLQVFVCGGDAGYFDKMNEFSTFVLSNLVLEGLNAILRFHETT